jgi:hypothetical protein
VALEARIEGVVNPAGGWQWHSGSCSLELVAVAQWQWQWLMAVWQWQWRSGCRESFEWGDLEQYWRIYGYFSGSGLWQWLWQYRGGSGLWPWQWLMAVGVWQ